MILGHQLPKTKAPPPAPQTAFKTPSAMSWVLPQKLLIPLVGAREPNPQFECLRSHHPHFQPKSRRSPQPRKDPAPPSPRLLDTAGEKHLHWCCTMNYSMESEIKTQWSLFYFLSFMWKRQDTRCTLSGSNNDCQNRRILIEFNTEADKRGEQQRKQYYTILRTINHLLV